MGDLLSQLAHLFVQTIPTVVFVFFLVIILDRVLFRPIISVLKQREEATSGALARAKELAATAEAKVREYEASFQAARQEVYRQREADRRVALSEREDRIRRARAESEASVKAGLADLASQADGARKQLGVTTQSLAQQIAASILSEAAPDGREGRA